jgi:hypothetical protein
VDEKGSLIKVRIITIQHPPIGPKTNPPSIAGKLENCTSKKLGNKKGRGNLGTKYRIMDKAEKMATLLM